MSTCVKSFCGICLSLLSFGVKAQDSTSVLTLSGYVETYFNGNLNQPKTNNAPAFLYNFNRTGEVNVNLAYLKAAYANDWVRGNLALAAGTYMNANYAAEPGVLKNMLEANVGFKMLKNADLWLDAGVLPAHIGFESAVGKDNWTLSRSLVAENSPYFETGARLGWTSKDQRWYVAGLYLNGWQRIQRINTVPAFGTQVSFKPVNALTINYSTFFGSDRPDSLRRNRSYHNVYAVWDICSRWAVKGGVDVGFESDGESGRTDRWYVPVMIVRYMPSPRVSLAGRAEYFNDPHQVMIGTGTTHGFRTMGFSVNADYQIMDELVFRTEVRHLQSQDAIFQTSDANNRSNVFIMASLALSITSP